MCGMVIQLVCLDVPSEPVSIDTYIKWLLRISISRSIDKVTCVLQFDFFGTSVIAVIQFRLRHWFMIETWFCDVTFSNISTVAIFYNP